MSDAIETARRLLEARLAEIDSEAAKLRSAVESLGAGGSASTRRPPTGPKRRPVKRSAKRAPRGQRRKQFLAAAKKAPGATAAELGKQMAISTNQAYALGQRLLKDGEVKKSGKGYKIA